jgi:beta-glucosidase
MDRPDLRLPNEQDLLIRAVAAANPRTVVVLMNAGPIEVASWEEGVPSILEGWYGGQEQGAAIARVLFGDVNPSGKLPITFPRDESQTPIATPEQYPGIGGAVHYSEGVYVGYRGYEKQGIEPQYPFGHGLSYTTFAYENLQITPAAAAGGETVTIRFDIQNTGSWAGAEVTQVYLLPPGAEAKRLAGWERVYLEPGQRREVSVVLEENQGEHPFSTWDSATSGWRLVEGEYGVIVGGSVQDVRLVGKTVVGA